MPLSAGRNLGRSQRQLKSTRAMGSNGSCVGRNAACYGGGARRCDDAPLPLPDPPDLLGRPPTGPGELLVVTIRAAHAIGRPQLDQVLDLEAVRVEQPVPLAVRQLEGRRLPVVEPVHPEVRDDEPIRDTVAVEWPGD